MQQIVIFGATGSIGTSTLDVLRQHRDKYTVFALTGHHNSELLFSQCREFNPVYAHISDPLAAQALQQRCREAQLQTQVLNQASDLAALASNTNVDIVMSAIVGSAGLLPTYAAAKAGKRILLANKESLVAGGALITQAVSAGGATLIPVDSEHSAIFQALPFAYTSLADAGVSKIILTASGGPFLKHSRADLEQVTAAEAIRHPNWSMGRKISVDSSTLMNKGLEVIEAHWLFSAAAEQIEVVVHPQSIIHSMVAYCDGSIIAQMGTPDMKTPIAYALSAPQRIASGTKSLNFLSSPALTFMAPDLARFPCLQIALDCLRMGGAASAVVNAANEIAVDKFLAGEHGFYAIPAMLEQALQRFAQTAINSLSDLTELDQAVRNYCQTL